MHRDDQLSPAGLLKIMPHNGHVRSTIFMELARRYRGIEKPRAMVLFTEKMRNRYGILCQKDMRLRRPIHHVTGWSAAVMDSSLLGLMHRVPLGWDNLLSRRYMRSDLE